MKVEPKQAPVSSPTFSPGSQSPQSGARERAIATLMGTQPVPNANNVSPEELGAIRQPSASQEDSGQIHNDEATTQEASAPQEQKQAPQEDKLSSQYAILARKEKALRAKIQAQEAESKAKEASFQAQVEQAVKAKEQELLSKYIPRERLSQDTWNVLAEAGVTYDELTRMALNPPPAESPAQKAAFERLTAEIKSLRDSQDETRKSFQEQQENSYKQAVNQIKSEVKHLAYTDPNFEMIKATNSVNDVVELIEKTFKADGVLLSVEEASQAVEDYLADEAVKYSQISKVQKRLQAKPKTQPQAQQQTTQKQQSPGMKTLTNQVTSSRKLSSRERAILAFKGEKA